MLSNLGWWRALAGAVAIAAAGGPAFAQSAVLTLPEALARAQAQSPQVAAAEAAVRAVEGRARQAGFSPNPEARVDVENFSGTGPYRDQGATETTILIGQVLELGGKRRARLSAAQAEVKAARIRLAIARADLMSDVRTRFAEAVAAKARLALARAAASRAEDLVRVAQLLVDVGREPPLRALRARTAAAQAAADATAAEAAYSEALRALTALWGDPDTTMEVVGSAEGPIPAVPVDPTEGLDVRLAEAELATARAVVDRERAGAAPDVTVEAGVRRFEDTRDQAFIVGVTAPIPIRNRNQGEVAAARAEAQAAEARRLQALAEAARKVRNAQAAVTAADARMKALRGAAIPEAEEAVRLARLGYEAGKFSLLDVLDAQAALDAARTAVIEAELARTQASAALERAAARPEGPRS